MAEEVSNIEELPLGLIIHNGTHFYFYLHSINIQTFWCFINKYWYIDIEDVSATPIYLVNLFPKFKNAGNKHNN